LYSDYDRLAQALDLRGLARLRWVTLPRLARPLGFGAGVAAALSMGDLGVIALFAGDAAATLPLMVRQLMGVYRTDAASAAALLLVTLSFGLFWLFDWGGRRSAAT
jgi:thiamine transport system permease protein